MSYWTLLSMMIEKLQTAHPNLRGHFAPAYLVRSNKLRAYLFFIYVFTPYGVRNFFNFKIGICKKILWTKIRILWKPSNSLSNIKFLLSRNNLDRYYSLPFCAILDFMILVSNVKNIECVLQIYDVPLLVQMVSRVLSFTTFTDKMRLLLNTVKLPILEHWT